MRVSVLSVWRVGHDVIAGLDPWDIVDEAWSSMAARGFETKGPFLPHALTVARNKAVDALRRGEARRNIGSIDAPLADEPVDSAGADVEYFRGLDHSAAMSKLALAEEALESPDVLTDVERQVFMAVRIDGKSRAAVGRELVPPLTGQRVGQIAARALMKIQAYVKTNEDRSVAVGTSGRGGPADG